MHHRQARAGEGSFSRAHQSPEGWVFTATAVLKSVGRNPAARAEVLSSDKF